MHDSIRSVLVVLCVVGSLARAQEPPPSIKYGGDRSSKTWLETKHGKVAVDEGVAWQGVKVYLSLMWDLIGTDEATGKVLWATNVGAFWNEIGFKEVETGPGVKAWAVELRPGGRRSQGAELRQYHELKTGNLVPGPADDPSGTKVDLARRWSGRWCSAAKPVRRLVGSEADWKATVLDGMFADGKDVPEFGAIDFEKNVVLVVAMGEISNCNGVDASAWEDDHRFLVRLREQWFQTEGPNGGGQKVRPFGIFVLPRREPFKPVIVERNRQRLIGGPAMWTEAYRFTALGDAPAESRPAKQQAK
jgi:hypothetical protein